MDNKENNTYTKRHVHIRERIKSNDIAFVRLALKDSNVDPYFICNSFLKTAVKYNHVEMVKTLMEDERISPYHLFRFGYETPIDEGDPSQCLQSVIQYAFKNKRFECIHVFLQTKRLDHSLFHNESLLSSCEMGCVEFVKILLKDENVTPYPIHLSIACREGHAHIVQLLLDDGRIHPSASIDNIPNSDNQALRDSIYENHIHIVRMLLNDHRLIISNTEKWNPIMSTVCQKDVEMTRVLLEDGRASPTKNNNEALFRAFRHDQKDIFDLLFRDVRVFKSLIQKDAVLRHEWKTFYHHKVKVDDITEHVKEKMKKDVSSILYVFQLNIPLHLTYEIGEYIHVYDAIQLLQLSNLVNNNI